MGLIEYENTPQVRSLHSQTLLLHDIPNSLTSTELDHVCHVVMLYCKEGGDRHF